MQARQVGGGAAGGPAFSVGDTGGPAALQPAAEDLVHRVIDGLCAGREEWHQAGTRIARDASGGSGAGRCLRMLGYGFPFGI